MDRKNLVKTTCRRCGKKIYTSSGGNFTARPSYRKYGRICAACLTEQEGTSLSMDQVQETSRMARRYRIAGKIDWKNAGLEDGEELVLRFLAMRIYYTGLLPAAADVYREFPEMDVESCLLSLEKRGFIQSLF